MQLIVNGAALELPEAATISALIQMMSLNGKRLAVEVNGDIVPRSAHQTTRLNAGDHVEVVQAIGGG